MTTIDTLEAIQAGGTTQWIRIRGADTSNSVLLLIQQGPGLPMINEARFAALEFAAAAVQERELPLAQPA